MHSILAARSEFSIGESILGIKELVEAAKEVEAKAIALTDTMSVTGMIDLSNEAKKADIKPIIGCRLRLVDDPSWRREKGVKVKAPPVYYLTYYVLSETGMKALFRLLSLAHSEERFYYEPRLSFDDLFNALRELTADDVALATGDTGSILHHPNVEYLMTMMSGMLGTNSDGRKAVFITLNPLNTPYWDALNLKGIELAGRAIGAELLVARPVFYKKGDADPAEIMNAVARNIQLLDQRRWAPAYRDAHAMNQKELLGEVAKAIERANKRKAGSVSGMPPVDAFRQGLLNTDLLVNRVKYIWSKQPVSLPKMAEDEFAAVVAECKKGWAARFAKETFGHKPTLQELKDVYQPRLAYELSVLKKLGFAGYFLLVQDIVQYAKKNGIFVGPGRGSVGGSLVAYLMGITDCDPIRFGLLFERFINPDRIDLPDADLDFMSGRRHEIIEYLVRKYGEARVAGISNFNSLAAASTIRGVGKAFGLTEKDYSCSKLTPKAHGANIPLPKSVEMVPEIAEFRDRYKPIWNVMVKLEGCMTSYGSHAAGVVVGGCDLIERAVIERRKEMPAVNWDKRTVEDMGLVKVDILGLETLDVIKLALDYIRERHGKTVDLWSIPLDDKKVLENFAMGRTTGVFQFESGGMRRLLKELGKDGVITFDDITAATALYRPGPMESGMMDNYWQRKQGLEPVEYDHPLMEPILKPTFGVMVYQEQVMQISRVIAGYSAPDADKLRKIMGKKLPEEMKKERGKFVEGCVKTIGCTEEWAGALFDKIEGFAGYGFNKSHSVEYTLISYQSMWLKTYYPVEFYAATLSLMKEDKLPGLIKDAEQFGIEVAMPDINVSTGRFEILNDTTLCIPFNRLKGVSSNATDEIVRARAAGPFTSIADLQARVERRKVNSKVVDVLNRVGAFARIEPGQLPAKHPDRILDQRELIPGLISEAVPVHRDMKRDALAKSELAKLIVRYRAETAEDGVALKPFLGKDAKFMAIADAPTSSEERNGQFAMGDSFRYVEDALKEAGMMRSDGYWTGLLKRPKAGKQVMAEEIKLYWPYLEREIAILKPPVIALLGSAVVRHFFPDFKGKAFDSACKVLYSKALDANFVIGFNPGEIYHDGDKQETLNAVFQQVASLL